MKKVKKIKSYLVGILLFGMIALPTYLVGKFYYGYLFRLRPLTTEQLTPAIAAPANYGISAHEITLYNAMSMQEIKSFAAITPDVGVIRISEDPDRKYFQVVYTDGAFRRWDIQTGENLEVYDFLVANESAVFNANGSLLMMPGDVTWDTQAGVILCRRGDGKCPTHASLEDDEGWRLDPVRRIKISYWSYSAVWYSVDKTFTDSLGVHNGGLGCWDYVADYDPFEGEPKVGSPRVNGITVDSSGTYLACALQSGAVIVRDWSLSFDRHIGKFGENATKDDPYIHLLRYNLPNRPADVKEMEFDPSRTWLAALTDQHLVIWDLRRWFFANHLEASVSDGYVISFDRTGKLLALGTKQGITLYDVERAKKITTFEVGEVTNLYFTRDNRLLVWGDADGNLHLWGVPNP